MTDLLGAASRIDDAARVLDHILSAGAGGAGPSETRLVTSAVSDATTHLAAAMPTGLGGQLRSMYVPYDLDVAKLAGVRSQVAHLGAVTRAVHQLGGVDHVVSQGGLDAIDGAVDVIRGHLLRDANEQLRTATSVIDAPPFGISMSRSARADHLARVHRSMAAPMEQLRVAGMVAETGEPLVTRLRSMRHGDASRMQYDQVIRDARVMIDHVRQLDPGTAPSDAAWAEQVLMSSTARSIATERASRATLAVAPRLTTLADDAAVLAHADSALAQHAATLEAISIAIAPLDRYDRSVRTAFVAARQKLERATEDVSRIEQALADAPDVAREMAVRTRDLVSEGSAIANAQPNAMVYTNSERIDATVEHIRSLQRHVANVNAEPDLIRAGSDVAEELQEVLARPGERIDLDVVRDLLAGGAALRAKTAYLEHLPQLKPHPADSPRTSDVQQALHLLDEVELTGSTMSDVITKGVLVPADRTIDEPGLREATLDMIARADTALGTSAHVGERTAAGLGRMTSSLRDTLHGVGHEHARAPQKYELDQLLAAARTYRTELLQHAERMSDDGGLRAIAPTARPAQAAEARSRWILRELDALTAPAADAPSAEHVDDAARRATLTHQLLRNLGSVESADERQALLERAMTEYQALGPTWRMPDDVAIELTRLRSEIERTGTLDLGRQLNTTLPGYNTVPGMRRASDIASGLQAWAMFADGPLPESAADRLAVAARRGASVRTYLDSIAALPNYERERIRVIDQIDELRTRIATVDEIAGDAVPADVRRGLDEVFENFDAELARRTSIHAEYRDPGAPDPAVFASSPIEPWIAALQDAHRAARATAGEQLRW